MVIMSSECKGGAIGWENDATKGVIRAVPIGSTILGSPVVQYK